MKDPAKPHREPNEKTPAAQHKIVVSMDNVLNRVILILTLLAGIGLLVTPFLYIKKMGSVVIALALLLTMLVATLLIRRGRVRLSGLFTVSSVWLIFAGLIFQGGGLNNINVLFFISLTVTAGLLFGRRATILVAGAGIATGLGLALLAGFGHLPTPYFMRSPLGDWAQLSFALVLTANTLNLALRDREKALQMANEQLAERMESEKALRESEASYRQLFENAPAAIYRVDFKTGKFLKVNDILCEYLGCTQEEIKSLSLFELLTEKSQKLFLERLEKMARGEAVPETVEYEVVNKMGDRWQLLLRNRYIYDAEGHIVASDVVAHDITERKRAAEALQKSEERYRSLVENADEAILVIQEGRVKFANARALSSFGYSEQELLSLPVFEFVHPADREEATLRHQQKMTRSDSTPSRYTFRVIRKGGQIAWIEISSVLIDWEGSPATLNFITDITESREVETDRRNLEERLQRAEKMEALGQLAGGVAHDLNNVLGILSGYSELLLMEIPEGQRGRSYAEMIKLSTEKSAVIIQDLLTLARRGVTVAEVIDFNAVVSGFFKTPVFEKLQDDYPQVVFRIECDPELLNIKGSPVHLEKTLMNLVSNAAEAISGKGEVTIRTQSCYLDRAIMGYDEVKAGDYVVLTVSDTGIGIPAEQRDKIFEPFYTKKAMGRSGTGLGLAIVWGTVKDHKGYIDVQSEVGKGTAFTLYFPVTREEPATPKQKTAIEQYLGKGESVLVIDDIAEQRDVASALLTQLGYKVHAVSGGEEAVAYLKANAADILVLDMIMAPGMDGMETYQKVLKVNPRQKAILVSGFSETDRVREAQRLGAGVYVKKPYVMEKIGIAIRDELRR
ncbi:MAG: PAS domain S-box protein [Deltaproteobacteria bacterium]|nr:PAS domain S-box protein [Deltaproteobacteria bacterium]